MTPGPVIGITTSRYTREAKPPVVGAPESYLRAVEAAGGIPLLLPFSVQKDTWRQFLPLVHGLVFTGGGDIAPNFTGNGRGPLRGVLPQRDAMELDLIRLAVDRRLPFLAICRGIQVLNVAMGGTLYTHLPEEYPGLDHDRPDEDRERVVHRVDLDPESRLARWLGATRLGVNSIHHQGLRTLGRRLRVVGRAEDGLVEAVEVEDHPFGIGVQWHPELLAPHDDTMARLFRLLVDAARQYRQASLPERG